MDYCNHDSKQLNYCIVCQEIVCDVCNKQVHATHEPLCCKLEDAKQLAQGFDRQAEAWIKNCQSLEATREKHAEACGVLCEKLLQVLKRKPDLAASSLLQNWHNDLNQFVKDLEAERYPKAIPYIDASKVEVEYGKLESYARLMEIKHEELAAYLNHWEKEIANVERGSKASDESDRDKISFFTLMDSVHKAKLEASVSRLARIDSFDIRKLELELVQAAHKNYKEKLEELTADEKALTLSCNKNSEALKNLCAEIETKKQELATMNELIQEKKKMIAENEELVSAQMKLQKEAKEKEEALQQDLKAEKDSIDKQTKKSAKVLKKLNSEKEDLEAKIAALKKNQQESENERGESKKTISKHHVEANSASEEQIAQKEELQATILKKKKTIEQLDSTIGELTENYQVLFKNFEKFNESVKEIPNELGKLKVSFKEQEGVLSRTVRKYEELLNEKQDKNNQLSDARSKLKADMRSLRDSISDNRPKQGCKVVLQFPLSENASITAIAVINKFHHDVQTLFMKELANELKEKASPKVDAHSFKRVVKFHNTFDDADTFIKTLKSAVTSAYDCIFIENDAEAVDKGMFDELAKSTAKVERTVKLCIKLNGSTNNYPKELANQAGKFNQSQDKIQVQIIY